MLPLRSLAAAAVGLLLGLGLLSAPAGAEDAPDPALDALAWQDCEDPELYLLDLECATLEVPLDHDDPSGASIELALTLRRHTSSAEDHLGVLLTNPGGPGGSGLTLPVLADYVPGEAGGRYDWVGFDPRGVGDSVPSLHCSSTYFGNNRPSYVPATAGLYDYWLAKNRKYAAACADTDEKRSLLAHLGTVDTVRDMDAIRQALGAETLNYYGFSYGTYLGQVYATRFPDRVGRFVLDGVVDPSRVWYGANFDQAVEFNKNIGAFWSYLARYPGVFRLGRNAGDIRRGYFALLRKLDRWPAFHRKLGPSELTDAMIEAAYYVYDWDYIGWAYSQLKRKGRGGPIYSLYDGPGDDNDFAVYNATTCTDAPWPRWDQTRADAWATHAVAPFATWSNTWYSAPCLFWQAPAATSPPDVSSAGVTQPVLLVSETRDAATPYSGALRVRSMFPTASLVAGVGGTTHSSSLSGIACVDDTIADYLETGVVPARKPGDVADLACPAVQPVDPRGSGYRTASGAFADRLSPIVREDLIRAQVPGPVNPR